MFVYCIKWAMPNQLEQRTPKDFIHVQKEKFPWNFYYPPFVFGTVHCFNTDLFRRKSHLETVLSRKP